MTTAPGNNLAPSKLYLEIGKTLALQLAGAYALVNPGVALALAGIKAVLDAQAAVAAHNSVLVRAQTEGWLDTDPRWDAPLAEQQSRMDAVNARHAALPPA